MSDIETPKKDFTPLHGWDEFVMQHSETFGCFLWEYEDKQYLEECYPDEEERLEYAQECADSGEYGVAWLVPVPINRDKEGVALLLGHAGWGPEDKPEFVGIFSSSANAKAYLRARGAIAQISY